MPFDLQILSGVPIFVLCFKHHRKPKSSMQHRFHVLCLHRTSPTFDIFPLPKLWLDRNPGLVCWHRVPFFSAGANSGEELSCSKEEVLHQNSMWAGFLAQKRQALVYAFRVFTSRCWIVARNGGARSDQKWKKVRTLVGLPRYFPRCFFRNKNGCSNLGEAFGVTRLTTSHYFQSGSQMFSVSYEVCGFNFL